jgi:hypothetical protein
MTRWSETYRMLFVFDVLNTRYLGRVTRNKSFEVEIIVDFSNSVSKGLARSISIGQGADKHTAPEDQLFAE